AGAAAVPATGRRSGRSRPATPARSRPARNRTRRRPAGRFPALGPRDPAHPRRRAAPPGTPRPGAAAWRPGTRGGQHPRLVTSTYDARRLFLIASRPGDLVPASGRPATRPVVGQPARPTAISAPSLTTDSTQPTTAATGTHRRTVIPRANSRAASAGRDQDGHCAPGAVGVARDLMAGPPEMIVDGLQGITAAVSRAAGLSAR